MKKSILYITFFASVGFCFMFCKTLWVENHRAKAGASPLGFTPAEYLKSTNAVGMVSDSPQQFANVGTSLATQAVNAMPFESETEGEVPAMSIEDEKLKLRGRSDSDLKVLIRQIDKDITQKNYVARANSVGLSKDESIRLAEAINQKAAAQFLIVERSLASIVVRR